MGSRSRSPVLPVKFIDDTTSGEVKQHPSLPASKHPMKLLFPYDHRVLFATRRYSSIKEEKKVEIVSNLRRSPSVVVS